VDTRTILIVEDDFAIRHLLARDAHARGYRVLLARTLADVVATVSAERFEAAVVDLALGHESGLDAIRAIRLAAPDTEIVVVSGTTSLASAIESYELDAFAFVPKPFDVDQLFATIERARDHRAVVLANRRLMWEQQLINEVGDELRHLLDTADLVERVLRRLMAAMNVEFSAARLLNPETGEYDVRMLAANEELERFWVQPFSHLPRPSDRVLATRAAYRIDDLHQLFPGSEIARHLLRSALSVPMFAGNDLIGVLTVGSSIPARFGAEDERTLGVIANHVAVGVLNARLHAFVRAGKQEWEATFDAIGDPIAVFDRNGRIVRGNQALARHAGRPVTALRGLSCDAVGLCVAAFPSCAVGQARDRVSVTAEVTLPGDRIFNVTTFPMDDARHGAAIVQIAKDVTREIHSARRLQTVSDELAAANARLVATVERLKATQAQLLQAEKLSAIGQLVAGVAHELNNPLTSVIGYAQLLQEEVGDAAGGDTPAVPATLPHDLRRIAEESERAAKIVRNLLAFARRQSAERAEQDVADLVTRVLALRAYEFRLNAIDLQTSFEPGLPPVLGDSGQLQQALLNLLLNAEQAMRSRTVRRIHVGARLVPESEAVELFLADTGHGIQEENLRRIFDPFFTTREVGEGTGLGLSICYGIVRDHGGQIAVESRVGQGTTFKVLLPARSGDEPLRAVVVHRDQTERDYIAAALAGWGHHVAVAEGMDDARAKFAASAVDVAFIDHTLINTDLAGWRRALPPGERPAATVLLSEAAGTEGVAPPFELAALRAALRGLTKECV
jgi:two-component system, NtrC family, sensor kinase